MRGAPLALAMLWLLPFAAADDVARDAHALPWRGGPVDDPPPFMLVPLICRLGHGPIRSHTFRL